MFVRKNHLVIFLVLCAAAVSVRGLYIRFVPDSWYLYEDITPAGESYKGKVLRFEEAARNLREGKGYTIYSNYFGEYISYLHQYPPGFSCLLAGVYFLGLRTHLSIQLLQIGLTVATCVFLYGITCRIASPRTGLILVALVAFSPILARYDVGIEPAVSATTLTSMVICILIGAERRRGLWFGAAGLLAATASFISPDFVSLPVILLLAIAAAKGIRFALRYGSFFILFYLLGLSPLAAMNYATFKQAMVVPPCLGRGLVQGLGELSDKRVFELPSNYYEFLEYEGYFDGRPEERERVGEEIILFYPDPLEKDSVRRATAYRAIKEHPILIMAGILKKTPRLLAGNITGVNPARLDESASECLATPTRGLGETMLALLYAAAAFLFRHFRWIEWATVVLALTGAYFSRGSWRTTLIIAALPVYFLASHLPMGLETRMFTPALPFMYVFTALGIDALFGEKSHNEKQAS